MSTLDARTYCRLALILFSILSGLYLILVTDILLNFEFIIILIQIPLFILFVAFFILTIIGVIQNRQQAPIGLISVFIVPAIGFAVLIGLQNGLFWGTKILDATFRDDMSRLDLRLYGNGKYILDSRTLFNDKMSSGRYHLNGDTLILFSSSLVENGYFAPKIVVNRAHRKIYFRKLPDGSYETSFFYFEINSISIPSAAK